MEQHHICTLFHRGRTIRKAHFIGAGLVLLVISLLYGYFTFAEYFSRWFSHKTADYSLLNTLFGKYFWTFIFANYFCILTPIAILAIKKLRTIKLITIASILAVVGMWLNRYLIVIPTLETPYLPIQDTRPEFISYTGSWIEWSLSLAGIASFLLLFTLLAKFVPVVPISGIIEHEEKNRKPKKIKPLKIEKSTYYTWHN
jgi:molybdopterin-containing oxidoreductase family membrane subunit